MTPVFWLLSAFVNICPFVYTDKQPPHISSQEVALKCGQKPLVLRRAGHLAGSMELPGSIPNWTFQVQCAHINHVQNFTCSEHSNSSEGHIKSKIAYFVERISYAFTTIQSCSQTPRELRLPLELKPHLSHSHNSFWWSSKVIRNLPFLHNLGFLLGPFHCCLWLYLTVQESHVGVVTGAVYLCVLCIIITFASVHLRVCLKRILVNLSETSKCSCLSPWWMSCSDVYHDLLFNSGASQKKHQGTEGLMW